MLQQGRHRKRTSSQGILDKVGERGTPARIPAGTAPSCRSTRHVGAQDGTQFSLLSRSPGRGDSDLHPSSPFHPAPAPSMGHLPGVGSGALGPVVIISKCSSRAMAGVSSSSWGHATHTRRLLVLSVCAVSVCQSGDRTCPTPHVRSVAKQGTDLGCPGAAPAWPRRRPTILWRAEACPLSGICWGIVQGKLIRYKLFLIFQILFKPRPAAQLQAVHGSELRAASSAHRRGPRARGSPLPAQGLSSQPHPTNISPGSQERRARERCSHQPAPQETRRSTAELQVKQRASLTLCYRHTNRMLTRKDNLGYETLWMRLPRNGSARAKSAGATACHGT